MNATAGDGRAGVLSPERDAFGRMLQDHHHGQPVGFPVWERDDGVLSPARPAEWFFAPAVDWPKIERRALTMARGRVLDLGCGAGRHSRWIQDEGSTVVAVDHSPGAVEVTRLRGVRDTRLAELTALPADLVDFDAVLMLCGNLGLAGSPERTRWLLRDLWRRTKPGALLLAHTEDPGLTEDPDELAYHARNERRGFPPGLSRLRLRYRTMATPWFPLYRVARGELSGLLDGTGWTLAERFDEGAEYLVALHRSQDR